MNRQGLYRIKDGWKDGEDSVVIASGGQEGMTVEITEGDYRKLGYQPAFDDLPWQGEGH